jgi:hypothetical protein
VDGAGGVLHPASVQGQSAGDGCASAGRRSLRFHLWIASLCGAIALLSGAPYAAAAPATHLYTWPGWEPDKGATAWYWVRFVDTYAEIHIVPAGTIDAPGILFDTPNGKFRRTQSSSTFESVLRAHPSADPAVNKLAQLARDIEINAWRPRALPESNVLEAAFRRLQQRWPNGDAPMPCILEFFDHVHAWLTRGGALDESTSASCGNAERQGNAR